MTGAYWVPLATRTRKCCKSEHTVTMEYPLPLSSNFSPILEHDRKCVARIKSPPSSPQTGRALNNLCWVNHYSLLSLLPLLSIVFPFFTLY